MGATKSESFTREQNELAAIARALAHPARIAIIQHLLKVNACIGGEIVEELPLAQPTVSRHLRELKEVGIIKGTVEGVRVHYCIDRVRWEEIRLLLGALLAGEVDEQSCC